MFKKGEKVELNGQNYIISPCNYASGYKVCHFCASVNTKPPCIKSFDYPRIKSFDYPRIKSFDYPCIKSFDYPDSKSFDYPDSKSFDYPDSNTTFGLRDCVKNICRLVFIPKRLPQWQK